MKATSVILIGGGAVALLYFLKSRKDKTISIAKPNVSTMPTTGGAKPNVSTMPTTSTPTNTGGASAGTSQVNTLPTPPESNEPEQVFGLGLPTGMDLPALTTGTGIPTEVAIQQGGVVTKPEPLISETVIPKPIDNIISPILEPRLPIYDDPYKGQGGFQQYPEYIQPIDEIIEPIRKTIIEPREVYNSDPISIEVNNPNVFQKEVGYITPSLQNFYRQEYVNVDRELFNINQ